MEASPVHWLKPSGTHSPVWRDHVTRPIYTSWSCRAVYPHKVKTREAAHGHPCVNLAWRCVCAVTWRDEWTTWAPRSRISFFHQSAFPAFDSALLALFCKKAYQSCKYIYICKSREGENHFNKTNVRRGVHTFRITRLPMERGCQ